MEHFWLKIAQKCTWGFTTTRIHTHSLLWHLIHDPLLWQALIFVNFLIFYSSLRFLVVTVIMYWLLFCLSSSPYIPFSLFVPLVRLSCVFWLHRFTPNYMCQMWSWRIPARLDWKDALSSEEVLWPRSVPAAWTRTSEPWKKKTFKGFSAMLKKIRLFPNILLTPV